MKLLIIAALIFVSIAASLLVTGGLVWLVCWAFGWAWSWKITIGVWAILFLIGTAVKSSKS